MKITDQRHTKCRYPISLNATCLMLGLILFSESPLSAQTSVIQARGVLESADVELLQAQVLDGTRIVKVIPHGTRVTKGTVLLEFEHRQAPAERARRQVIMADNDLRSALKEREVLENFTKPRTIEELLERSNETKRHILRVVLSGEAQHDFVKASVAAAQLEYNILLSRVNKFKKLKDNERDEALFEESQIQLAHSEVKLKAAKRDLDVQFAKYEHQLAESHLEKKLAELDLQQYKNGDYIAQQEALQTRIEVTREKLKRRTESYGTVLRAVRQTQLSAPTDGIIFHHNLRVDGKPFALEPGVRVQQGQVLLRFANLSTKHVRVAVCETDILRLTEGQAASVRFPALPTQEYAATVKSISELPRVEKPNPGQCVEYDVILEVADLPARLKLGMTCEVKFVAE